MSTLEISVKASVGALELEVSLPSFSGTLALVGPNGAGKSTLLSMLLGVRRPRSGRIVVGEAVLFDSARGLDMPIETRRLAWVPQDSGLFPHLSVRGNVEFAVDSARTEAERTSRANRANELIEELELGGLTNRRISTLSGGERQRVALARALTAEPRALLLDEPLAALDVESREDVRQFLARWLERLTIPSVVVTHDPADARMLGRTIAVLERGKVTVRGSWDDVSRSTSGFAAAFGVGAPSPRAG